MEPTNNTGIIIIKSLNPAIDGISYDLIVQNLRSLKGVSLVMDFDLSVNTNVKKLTDKLSDSKITRLILAGDTPGFYKGYFEQVMSALGKNSGDIVLASFLEYGLTSVGDTDMAIALITSAVYGIPFEVAAVRDDHELISDTLVIGGGIAGIQASLELADGNVKVFLVEKSGTIGGKMAMFDKTFPTLDCAACILTPKMVEVNQHPNITLMTYSEVTNVEGNPGNYTVTVLKKARRVNVATCIGCGNCAERCPATAPSEFDAGTTLRKAIYIPFPQAVPNKYLIDETACIYLKNGKCRACVKACLVPDCINLDEKDESVTLKVGNIIVATGFKPFDAKRIPQFGYGQFPNVVTSLEFERLLNASGPTGGNIHLRGQDKKGNWVFTTDTGQPKRISIIHCIGSRDENYNSYCSRVCCMYSLKFAHLVKEKLPEAEVFEFYIDMRAFGKGYEEFYNRIRNEGIHIIRGKTAKVESKNGHLHIRGEHIENFNLIEMDTDMVVLSIGLEPSEDTTRLSQILGIRKDCQGWFREMNSNTNPTGTGIGGIYLAGACQGPKDIPDSVAQGSAAAASVLQNVIRGKVGVGLQQVSPANVIKQANELSLIS